MCRIRRFAGVLAGLVGAHGVGEQAAGECEQLVRSGRPAERHARDLAVARRLPCLGAVVVLAVPLFAGTASAMAATSPAGNAPIVSGWNVTAPIAVPRLGWVTPLLVNTATSSAMPRSLALASKRYPSAFIEWKLSARPPHQVAPPRPPTNAFGRYPSAFIEWKLSARPPPCSKYCR